MLVEAKRDIRLGIGVTATPHRMPRKPEFPFHKSKSEDMVRNGNQIWKRQVHRKTDGVLFQKKKI
jgi:hypothetical protein